MGDYHRARWAELQQAMPDKKVFAADLGGADNLYGWDNTKNDLHFRLSDQQPGSFDFRRLTRLRKFLKSKNINTVCIAGYGRPEYILSILYCFFTRRKIILFAESWYPGSPLIDVLKSLFLKVTCDGFLVSGVRAFTHFTKRLRVNTASVRIGYSVIDNQHFARRESRGEHASKVLLCVARFVDDKNLVLLINSFLRSELPGKGWALKLIGGGPLESRLRQMAEGKQVYINAWVSYDELPAHYHNADVFILPSRFEPWGLVVNEAMAAELPVILSNAVGCLPDLVTNDNGWTFSEKSEDELVQVLSGIASLSHGELMRKGASSKSLIEEFGLPIFAANLKGLILKL